MAKKAKGGKKSKQKVTFPSGEVGYGNVDSAGNLVLDYKEFFGCTAQEMAQIIRRYTSNDWTGIGVDPHSGMGSFEAVLEAVYRESSGIPANLDGHVVVLCQVSPNGDIIEYFDPADNGRKTISMDHLREMIRSAAVPTGIAQGVTQNNSEMSRAQEPAFG